LWGLGHPVSLSQYACLMHNWAGLLGTSGHLPDPPSIRVDTLVEHPMLHALLSA